MPFLFYLLGFILGVTAFLVAGCHYFNDEPTEGAWNLIVGFSFLLLAFYILSLAATAR